jgi:hypothetical protein
LNLFTGAMDDPSRVLTDRERAEHEALNKVLFYNVDVAVNPQKYSPLLQALDAAAGGPAGALA